jgi:hypothetical protein
VVVSVETLRRWMIEAELWVPRSQGTRRVQIGICTMSEFPTGFWATLASPFQWKRYAADREAGLG